MNMLEFPRHISAKNADDAEIIGLVQDFFDETMCLYKILELEQLLETLEVKIHNKENFEVVITCNKNPQVIDKLKNVYHHITYFYYGNNILVESSKQKDYSLLMNFKLIK